LNYFLRGKNFQNAKTLNLFSSSIFLLSRQHPKSLTLFSSSPKPTEAAIKQPLLPHHKPPLLHPPNPTGHPSLLTNHLYSPHYYERITVQNPIFRAPPVHCRRTTKPQHPANQKHHFWQSSRLRRSK